jgi:hypothetical protein
MLQEEAGTGVKKPSTQNFQEVTEFASSKPDH